MAVQKKWSAVDALSSIVRIRKEGKGQKIGDHASRRPKLAPGSVRMQCRVQVLGHATTKEAPPATLA